MGAPKRPATGSGEAADALAHDLQASHITQYTDDRDTSDGQLISS